MADILDQSNYTGATGIGFGDTGNGRDYLSQGFIPTLNNITAVSFRIADKDGSGSIGYKVWIDTCDTNSKPAGSVGTGIGGATEITNAALVTGALTKYTLTTPVTGLIPGNRYCFVIAPWNTSTHVFAASYHDVMSSTANPYASGKRNHGDTAYTTWSTPDSGNDDILFETYGNATTANTGFFALM